MVFEQTNSYQIVLPLMFVCVVSQVTVRFLKSRSVEEESLLRRGIKLPHTPESSVMQTISVRDVMHEEKNPVPHSARFAEIVERFLNEPHSNLHVVDDNGRYLGAIRLHSLKEMLHQSESLTTVIARDLVDDTFPFFTPDQRLADTMETFWREHAERLPVLDNTDSRHLLGWISKRDLFGVYNQEILHKRQLLNRFIVKTENADRDVYVELPEGFELSSITIPSLLANRSLSDLALRSKYNLHVLQIKRRDPQTGRPIIEIPDGNTRLHPGDQLVVIGPAEGLANFELAIYSTVDEHPVN
jgi:CBS-domain-containing membrane protein